jgi:ABC-type nitrate/sulfonate/bicarbonate transport system substrate-binding protein
VDSSFQWPKLKGKKFLHVHGGQPEAMLRYALYKEGVDLDELDRIESKGGEQMMQQWLSGEGDYFHEQGSYPQQLEHLGKGHVVAAVGPSIGPVAFSSLVCRWDWTDSDDAKRFAAAYSASRQWINNADPMAVAKAEASFFPDMAIDAIAAAVAFYQKLDNWGGDIAIDPQDYETTLDVFAHSHRITKRHDYDAIIIAPPWSQTKQVRFTPTTCKVNNLSLWPRPGYTIAGAGFVYTDFYENACDHRRSRRTAPGLACCLRTRPLPVAQERRICYVAC